MARDGTWAALQDGARLRVGGKAWRLAVVDCGELLPSGRLVNVHIDFLVVGDDAERLPAAPA